MKAKKFFINTFILLIFAAVIFFIGWIQFYCAPGNCIIMTSKTSGIYEKPIMTGTFTWRPERLLPTNVSLISFDLSPYKSHQNISGELKNGSFYSSTINEKADFTYSIQIDITLQITPEKIYTLFTEGKIKSNDDLKDIYEDKAKTAAQIIAESLLNDTNIYSVKKTYTSEEILSIIMNNNSMSFDGISISNVILGNTKVPDINLYKKLVKASESYIDSVNTAKIKKAESMVGQILEEERKFKQLENLSKLLKENPDLNELIKSGEINKFINLN